MEIEKEPLEINSEIKIHISPCWCWFDRNGNVLTLNAAEMLMFSTNLQNEQLTEIWLFENKKELKLKKNMLGFELLAHEFEQQDFTKQICLQ